MFSVCFDGDFLDGIRSQFDFREVLLFSSCRYIIYLYIRHESSLYLPSGVYIQFACEPCSEFGHTTPIHMILGECANWDLRLVEFRKKKVNIHFICAWITLKSEHTQPYSRRRLKQNNWNTSQLLLYWQLFKILDELKGSFCILFHHNKCYAKER